MERYTYNQGCWLPIKVRDSLQQIVTIRTQSALIQITIDMRRRYARTVVNDERVLTVDATVLEFWSALYQIGASTSAFSLMKKGCEKSWSGSAGRIKKGSRFCSLFLLCWYLSLLRTSVFKLWNTAENVPCLSVASPSKHSDHCALVPH